MKVVQSIPADAGRRGTRSSRYTELCDGKIRQIGADEFNGKKDGWPKIESFRTSAKSVAEKLGMRMSVLRSADGKSYYIQATKKKEKVK